MRVGVTSDTTQLGFLPTKVSDIEVEEASGTFPTYDASAGSCGMEMEIPLLQNVKSNLGSSPSASVPGHLENISQQTSHDLNILSWNLQGYSHEKYKVLQNFHIIMAQEAQYPQRKDVHFHKYQCYRKERDGNPLMTLILSKIPSVRMIELETQNTLVVKVIFRKFQLLVVNIHLTSTTKLEWKATLETFQYAATIIGGDINYQLRKNPNHYYDLVTHKATRRYKDGTKFKQIDYLMVNRNIEWKNKILQNTFYNFSDHKPISISFQIPQEDLFQRPIINSKQLNQYIDSLDEKPYNMYEYMKIANQPGFFNIKFMDFKIIINKNLADAIQACKSLLFSKQSKEFYDIISHSRNLKPFKKEGSIMNVIQQDDGNLICCYKRILNICIQDLIVIQGKQLIPWCLDLPKNYKVYINRETIENLAQNKKAVSFDLVELPKLVSFLDQDGAFYIDFNKLTELEYLFSMRLIPLNKMHPMIPIRGQFRPIMVISHFVKLFEASYVQKFKTICSSKINPSQIGFVSYLGCSQSIDQIISELKDKTKGLNKGRVSVFMDLSNAYNMVRRQDIFKQLRENKQYSMMFNQNEIYALQWMYEQLYIYDPIEKEKVYFQNGVHQGSLLAPFLFDIYFIQLIDELERRIRIKLICNKILKKQKENKFQIFLKATKVFAYADDVAITTFDSCAGWVVEQFLDLAEKYGFKVNVKKSNYISNKKSNHQDLVKLGILKVKNFKYLGVFISPRGNINEHRKHVQTKVKFLCDQLKNLSRILPLRHMTQLWLSYIKPHFDYVAPLMKNYDVKEIEKWRLLYRGSIKRILCLAKSTANSVIDDLWRKFGLQPTALMKQTDEQIARLNTYRKQDEGETFRNQIDKKIENLQQRSYALQAEADRIRQEDLQIIQQQGFYPNFSHKMKYLPAFGYLSRYKHSWKKCSECGCQWSFDHVERHDPVLYQDYLSIESYINQCALEQSLCYREYPYRRDLCFHFYTLNQRFDAIVEKTTYVRTSEVLHK